MFVISILSELIGRIIIVPSSAKVQSGKILLKPLVNICSAIYPSGAGDK